MTPGYGWRSPLPARRPGQINGPAAVGSSPLGLPLGSPPWPPAAAKVTAAIENGRILQLAGLPRCRHEMLQQVSTRVIIMRVGESTLGNLVHVA